MGNFNNFIAADVDFKPLIQNFINTLRKNDFNDDDISIYIKTPKGRADFINYCDACLRVELTARFGVSPDIGHNKKDVLQTN